MVSRGLADSWGGEVSTRGRWGWESEIGSKRKSNTVIQIEISYISCHCSVLYKKHKTQFVFL